MKIVCDSCGAKYSIADEKVAGKVFKIRCKKCSAIIMVRGDQLDQGPHAGDAGPPAAEPDYPADAVWHVVVNGEQQGPYTPGQIAELMNAGSFDWDGYVWREGFEGWLVARDVGELVEAVSGPQAQQSQPDASPFAQGGMPEPGLGQPNGHDPYGAPAGGDPFGAPAAGDPFGAPAGDPFGAAAADPDPGGLGYGGGMDSGGGGGGADLFAQTGPSPFEGGGDVVASSAAPGALSGEQAMTGQRNENSVLFSLQNLQALAGAADSPAGGASPGIRANPGVGANLGQATGEGSGLIDIRALAGATGVVGGEPSLGGPRAPESVDNLMSIGTGSPLNSALGAPVLAPVQEEKNNRGLIIAMVSAAGLLAVAAIVIAVVLVTKEPEPVAQASGVPGSVAGLAPTPDTPAPPTSAGSAPAADTLGGGAADPGQAGSAAGSDSPAAGNTSRSGGRGQAGRRRDRTARQARGGAAPTMAASPTSAPSSASSMASRSRGGSGSIDDLLNAALGGGGGGGMSRAAASPMGGGSAGGAANLPDTPPRDAVLRALRSVQNAVSACGRGQHGVATTAITVSGSTGRVSSANVTGQFAGTPIGSCVARAVRGARFPRFKRATFNVSFPYRI